MAESFPPDEFDSPHGGTGRAGAHRQRRLRGRQWIILGSCVLVVVLIAFGGYGLLSLLTRTSGLDWQNLALGTSSSSGVDDSTTDDSASSSSASASASASSSAAATVNYAVSISVLNATNTAGIAASAKSTLTKAGWTSVTSGNATAIQKESVVAYANAANKSTAKAIAKAVGIDSVKLDASISTDIVVTLGTEYFG